jgi:hypothetical protein
MGKEPNFEFSGSAIKFPLYNNCLNMNYDLSIFKTGWL